MAYTPIKAQNTSIQVFQQNAFQIMLSPADYGGNPIDISGWSAFQLIMFPPGGQTVYQDALSCTFSSISGGSGTLTLVTNWSLFGSYPPVVGNYSYVINGVPVAGDMTQVVAYGTLQVYPTG